MMNYEIFIYNERYCNDNTFIFHVFVDNQWLYGILGDGSIDTTQFYDLIPYDLKDTHYWQQL